MSLFPYISSCTKPGGFERLRHGFVGRLVSVTAPRWPLYGQPMSSRHPALLVPLCLIEATERFAAALLGALVLFHLADDHHLRPGTATTVVAIFMSLTYGLGIVGGLVTDRYLGYRRALSGGLILLTLGYGVSAVRGPLALTAGLGLLVLGHALFKPTITALIGVVYAKQPELRVAGFSWFYAAVNGAALVAPVVAATLRPQIGWSMVMGVASSSVALGLCVCGLVIARVPKRSVRQIDPTKAPGTSSNGTTAPPWVQLGVLLLAMLSLATISSQSQGTLLFFAKSRVVRTIGSRELPPEAFPALPALLVLVLKPMLDLTRRIGRAYGVRLPLRRQLIIGLVLASGAFGLLALACALNGEAKLGLGWLLGALCLLSAAELLVIPGAMALVAELFSQQYGALSQGLLFGAQALGYLCSGILASQWGRKTDCSAYTDASLAAAHPMHRAPH